MITIKEILKAYTANGKSAKEARTWFKASFTNCHTGDFDANDLLWAYREGERK